MDMACAFFIISIVISSISGARILGVYEIPTYSHYQLGSRLFKALAARGHEVTLISPFEENYEIQNYRSILISKEIEMNLLEWSKMSAFTTGIYTEMAWISVSERTLNSTNVQNLIKSNEKFDVVIIEQLYNHAFKGFCHHFEGHCIISSSIAASRWINPQMGNPNPPSYIPDRLSTFTNKMNFFERIYNSLLYVIGEIFLHVYVLPAHNDIMQKYFPNVPQLKDIYYNVSLMLLNSQVSTTFPMSLQPNMIEIGGFHITPPKPLANDLQQYLDDSKDGVIVFSLGSFIKSKDLSAETLAAILKSFSKVKQNILWKWENESLPGQPPNVKILKWLPQNDVLAHPNVKALVNHGGLLSSMEAIYHGIPIVGMSVYVDQHTNSRYAEQEGYGIYVPYTELTEETFSNALEKIINDQSYWKNAQKRSKIIHDQPMKPLDRAVYWIEYILRHEGAHHLRSPGLNLEWYQYLLLDVVAVAALLVAIPILTCCYFFNTKRTMKKNGKIKKLKQK